MDKEIRLAEIRFQLMTLNDSVPRDRDLTDDEQAAIDAQRAALITELGEIEPGALIG